MNTFSIGIALIVFALSSSVAKSAFAEPCKENVDKGAYDDAIAACTRQIESEHIASDLSDYYNHRGIAYGHKKLYAKEIEDYNMAIKLDPTNAHAYNNRGIAYADIGMYEKAVSDYNKAIELTPKHASAYFNMACLHSIRKDIGTSCKWLQKAIDLGYSKMQARDDPDLNNVRSSACYKEIMRPNGKQSVF